MINIFQIILKIFFFSLLSNFLLKIITPLLSKFFMREPQKRDSHVVPTPRAGGVIFVIFSYLMLIKVQSTSPEIFNVVYASTPIAIVGLIDDRYDISKVLRYFVQFLTAFLIFYGSQINYEINFLVNGFLSVIILILFLIGFTAIINFINFMDGIDGLVGGVMVIVFSYIALNNYPSLWFLVGSIIGFLFLNWHPSKIFMGDVGSTFLASIFLGFLSISNSLKFSLDYLLICSPLLIDAFICVLRRFSARQNIFTPHKEHLYQRLNKAGWSQSKVSFIYILGSILIALSAYYGNLKITISVFILEIMMGYILDKYYAVKFLNKIS